MDTHRAVESVLRNSYGRLIAYLSLRSGDVTAAEDALSEAFQSALQTWPVSGIPHRPEAWLLTTARRKQIDAARTDLVRQRAMSELLAQAQGEQAQWEIEEWPDERLTMMFLCAHPAIDANVRAPLMLQVVLGLDAARIGSAFLVQPSAMGQRLSRAKVKIRDAKIPFELPPTKELAGRLDSVLDAVYAAYGSGWEDSLGADLRRGGLATEAIQLGRLLGRWMPKEPEVLGLTALMLHCEARREARFSAAGEYMPLSEQDVSRWSFAMLHEAELLLGEASTYRAHGRFQLEAAIQSVHAQRLVSGRSDWEAVALLYEGLVRLTPSIGAHVGRSAAASEARSPEVGLALLEALPSEAVRSYQPYWALRAHLLEKMGRREEARKAYSQAIGLCESEPTRAFLKRKSGALGRF